MNGFEGFQGQRHPFQDIGSFFRGKSVLSILIIINAGIWILIRFMDVVFDLFNTGLTADLIGLLAVPANPSILATRPWTIFTYMFLHFDFWHILFNMLWLYWFGRIFTEFLNSRQLRATYILGGIAGALVYVASFNIFPKFQDVYLNSVALGASASVMAIVVVISWYVPNYRIHLLFIGPVRIYYIALFSIILDILMIKSQNSGGHLAHLGGALWGFLFATQLRRGRDITLLFSWLKNIRWNVLKSRRSREKDDFGQKRQARSMTDEEYNRQRAAYQKRIDEILDKISKSGYDSLTRKEKELLFKAGDRK